MKVKILLMPLLLVTAVFLAIWVVYPSYSNGIDGVKEKYATLEKEQMQLADINQKMKNAEELANQLQAMANDKEVLDQFIPGTGEEERILDSLNFFGYNSGLSLYGITISQPQKDLSIEILPEEGTPAEIAKPLEVKNLRTEVNLVGGYEKIKEFVNALERAKRHSDIVAFHIGKNAGASGEVDPSASVLTSNFTINFQKLEKATLTSNNIGPSVFSNGQLDNSVISEILNQRDASMLQLNADQKGKANPFAL